MTENQVITALWTGTYLLIQLYEVFDGGCLAFPGASGTMFERRGSGNVDRRDCNDNEMTEDFDYASKDEQMFHGAPLHAGSYFAFTRPGGFHVPSPGGRMEGGSVFGQ